MEGQRRTCTYVSCLHHCYERTCWNTCVNILLFQVPESSLVVFSWCHPTCCSGKLSTFSLGNSKSSCLANAYVDSQKLDAILCKPCIATTALVLSQIASEVISEHLISKIFLGEHASRPLYSCMLMHTYIQPCNPPSKNPGYRPARHIFMIIVLQLFSSQ